MSCVFPNSAAVSFVEQPNPLVSCLIHWGNSEKFFLKEEMCSLNGDGEMSWGVSKALPFLSDGTGRHEGAEDLKGLGRKNRWQKEEKNKVSWGLGIQSSIIHRRRKSPASEGHGEGKADTAVNQRTMRGHRRHWDPGPWAEVPSTCTWASLPQTSTFLPVKWGRWHSSSQLRSKRLYEMPKWDNAGGQGALPPVNLEQMVTIFAVWLELQTKRG